MRAILTLLLAVLLGGQGACTCRGKEGAKRGAAAGAVVLSIDGKEVARLDGAAEDIRTSLPEAMRDVAAWKRVDARAKDGRSVTIAHPARKYPNVRFEVREAKGATGKLTLYAVDTGGQRSRAVASLPDVAEVDITTVKGMPDRPPDAPTGPPLEVTVAGRAVTVPWKDVQTLPTARPKGAKQGGHRLDALVAKHADLAVVERVVVSGGGKDYPVSGADLRDPAQSFVLRLNRTGQIRFLRYGEKDEKVEDGQGGGDTRKGLRDVTRIAVELPP